MILETVQPPFVAVAFVLSRSDCGFIFLDLEGSKAANP